MRETKGRGNEANRVGVGVGEGGRRSTRQNARYNKTKGALHQNILLIQPNNVCMYSGTRNRKI